MKKPVKSAHIPESNVSPERVQDIHLQRNMTVHRLLTQLNDMGGFSPAALLQGIEILAKMMKDKECTRFLSFTANLVATGLRGVLTDLIRKGLADVVITTGGAVDHDVARSFGGEYFKGTFEADDKDLLSRQIHRLGNVFIPTASYGMTIERATRRLLDRISSRSGTWAPHTLLDELGSEIKDPNSFLAAASRRHVPVIVPGITDSAFGTNLFFYAETHRFQINPLLDMKLVSNRVFEAHRTGAIILGGGISKHHTLWWNQFKDGLTYAVSLTTASEYDGSLSGARLHEAITWGKIKPDAENVTIDGDATLLFPLMVAELYTRLGT